MLGKQKLPFSKSLFFREDTTRDYLIFGRPELELEYSSSARRVVETELNIGKSFDMLPSLFLEDSPFI